MSTVQHLIGIVTTTTVYGPTIRFFVKNIADTIQNYHSTGRFYEIEELSIIARHFPKGGIYLDVGANVGNHLIYVVAAGLTTNVIAIEPNPEAIEILRVNLLLNGLNTIDLQHLGLGLSDCVERAEVHTHQIHNLGETEMLPTPEGSIQLVRGDDLFASRRIDFVKIDVEGSEMKVLRGMAQTIENYRPVMFIEVDNANRADFEQWLQENRYVTAETFRRHQVNENFLIRPAENPAPAPAGHPS